MRKTLHRLTICLALTTFSLAVHAQSNNNKGATPVEVENGPNNPVPVSIQQDQVREPVLIEVRESRNATGASTLFVVDRFEVCVGAEPVCEGSTGGYTVPDGKQLVIHHISFRSRSFFLDPPPEPVGATLELTKVDNNQNFVLTTSFQFGLLEPIDPSLSISGKGFPTQITVPPGTKLVGRLTWANFFDGRRDGQFTIAGEYVDIP